MRRPGRFGNPVVQRRIAVGIVVLGGLLAGTGALFRALRDGSGSNSGTYLLDVAGWLTVIAGAVLEARASQFFFPAVPVASRRRAVAFTLIGVVSALAGCIVASTVADSDSPAIVPATAMVVLVGGVGSGLAGLFSLGAHYGGDYAARRIEKLGDEDW